MRHLAYAIGIVFGAAGVLLVLTALILWLGGRPNSKVLFVAGALCFSGGVFAKRASKLKKCFQCRDKVHYDVTRCPHCGFDLPANPAESLSQPFYK